MADDEILRIARERVGRLLREKYRLDRVIGIGGMATVYLATHRNNKQFFVHEVDNAAQLLVAAGSKPARALTSVAPQVPSAIAEVVDKGLAFDKKDRWGTASAMREAMRKAYGAPIPELPGSATATEGLDDTIASGPRAGKEAAAFAPTVSSGTSTPAGAASPASEKKSRAGRSGRSTVMIVSGVALLAVGAALLALQLAGKPAPAVTAPTAASPSASAPAPPLVQNEAAAAAADQSAPGLLGRHPCTARGSCRADATSWCDLDEKEIACCGPGLVAVGRDGLCECAPGGTTHAGTDCPAADRKAWDEALAVAEESLAHAAMACLQASDGVGRGDLEMSLALDPDGRVYKTHTTKNAMPRLSAQRCVLDMMKTAQLPPPPDGHFEVARWGFSVSPR